MATTPAMSLGSRAVASGLRGRRDARNVRIGYGPVRAETSPRDARKSFAAARRPIPRALRHDARGGELCGSPAGMGADGQTWDPLGLGRAIWWETGDDRATRMTPSPVGFVMSPRAAAP